MCAVFFVRKIDTVYENINQITVVFQTINIPLNEVVKKENDFVLCRYPMEDFFFRNILFQQLLLLLALFKAVCHCLRVPPGFNEVKQIIDPQNHGISLEQQEILERLKEDIASGAVTYVSSVMEQSLTTDENGKHTPHGHIAVYYPPQTHGGHLQKIFPMAALQNCNASILSVRQYLLKDPTGKWYQTHPEKFGEKLPDAEANFWEWGLLPDGKRKTPDSPTAKTLGEDVLQAIGDGKSDAEIMTLYPTIWNRSGELRKIRFLIMSQKFRPVYRDLNCIYIEANFPPKQIYKLFSHTPDTYINKTNHAFFRVST